MTTNPDLFDAVLRGPADPVTLGIEIARHCMSGIDADDITEAVLVLRNQLAAQRAIVAADDEYYRKLGILRNLDFEGESGDEVAACSEVNEAHSKCETAREEARRIDEVTR